MNTILPPPPRSTMCRAASWLMWKPPVSVAWTTRSNASGVYSSAASGVRDLADPRNPWQAQLDAIWFAHWGQPPRDANGNPNVIEPNKAWLPDHLWVHRRVNQYVGGHDECHGGVCINIDSNALDGPVVG